MKVILLERVERLGALGEIVTVKDGFARNYLLPRELAVAATSAAVKRIAHEKIVALAREEDAERVGRVLAEAMSEPFGWAPGLPLKAVAEISKVFVKT